MKTALRTTLAALVLAAFAMGAHAQAPKDPPKDPKAPPAKIPPKMPPMPPKGLHLQCPLAMEATVQEGLLLGLTPPPWRAVRSASGKKAYEFAEATLTPAQAGDGGVLTCKYRGLETTLQAALPKGCEPNMLGPWGGSSGAGGMRLAARELTCRPSAASATGASRLPSQTAHCALECAPRKP